MYDTEDTIYAFMRAYRPKGEGTALVRDGKRTSFPKFFRLIDRVARGLFALGIGRGDAVMIATPNIEQGIAAVYACSKIGAVASVVHPKLSRDEFARELRLQKPKAVFLSDISLGAFVPEIKDERIIFCPYFLRYTFIGLPYPAKKIPCEIHDAADDAAFYMHSGGTSGVPKTVVLSNKAVNSFAVNLLHSLGDGFSDRDVMFASLPIFHGYGMCVGIHAALSTGMAAVLVPKFGGKAAVKAFSRDRITTMIAIPRMLRKLLDTEGFCGERIRSLKNIYVGGDELSRELEDEFNARLKEAGSDGRVSAGYGLTEACSCMSVQREPFRRGSVGRALVNLGTKIIAEDGTEAESGTPGELYVSGDQLMSGYLGDEDATKQTFACIDGDRYLKTGDIFVKDEDGYLTYLGRKKRLIKISGINVFPIEIERVAKELPYVAECAATEVSVGGKTFIRLIVEGELSDKEKTAIRTHISKRLSHWHTPEYVDAVRELPRTKIGKIDYVRLKDEH